MDTFATALALGVMAGLALALPVGPVSLLVVQEGLARGFRVAAGAALGVATVDAVYATLATTAGGGVARALEAHVTAVRVVSALALVAVAAVGLRQTLDERSRTALALSPGAHAPGAGAPGAHAPRAGALGAPAGGALGPGSARVDGAGTPGRRVPVFARFVALTAVNPLTALAFASVAVALAPRLEGAGRAAFVVGVVAASAGWQLTLAAAGSALGARLGGGARTGLSLVGHAAVVVLAVVVVIA